MDHDCILIQALQLEAFPDVCSVEGKCVCTNVGRLGRSGKQSVSQGTVILHSVTKSLQIWVLGAEYKVCKVYDVSSQEGDGKAVMGQQVPAKIEDGYDPPRSH